MWYETLLKTGMTYFDFPQNLTFGCVGSSFFFFFEISIDLKLNGILEVCKTL